MSVSNTAGGHVLGTATTVTGASVLPAASGHHAITFYVLFTSASCVALVAMSKAVKRLAQRTHDRL